MSSRPPLELDVEIETPDGIFRRPCDHRIASKRPRGINCSTQRGDGFGPAGCSFTRPIFKDYPDISPLDTWRFVGRNGDIAHESRLRQSPRGNDPQQQLDVGLVGWMTYLTGRRCAPLIIDRRVSGWGEPSTQRKANLASAGFLLNVETSIGREGAGAKGPSLVFRFTRGAGATEIGELWYFAGGEEIGEVRFDFDELSGHGEDASMVDWMIASTDDLHSTTNIGTNYKQKDALNQSLVASPGMRYLTAQAQYTGAFTGDMSNMHSFANVRVLGRHGLEARGVQPTEGFWLSDIIRYVLATYFPKVKWAGLDNTYPVTQATWHDNPTEGFQLIQQLNDLALWETNMWEEQTFHFEPADLTRYDWIIRTTDPGVKVLFDGPSIEDFANGAEVAYTDFTGRSHILYPADHAELRDEDDANPANRHGEDLWTPFEVPWPCYEAEALQFGRARLAEFNRPKRPGRYRIEGGYIRDAARHWQQGWKPRNGETIGILDHPDDAPRLITATNWDAEGERLEITVDAPAKTLDAQVARQQRRREGANLV